MNTQNLPITMELFRPVKVDDIQESFYDIDGCSTTPLALALKITQTKKSPLPIGVMTDMSLIELITKATGYTPWESP